jgi:hypothetical protein
VTRILILFLMLASSLGRGVAEDHEVVGFLRHMDPPVSLRIANGQSIQLRMSDEGRLLHASDAVRVQGNGKILIYYVDGTKREMRASKEWQLVAPESVPQVTKPEPESVVNIRRALSEIALLGGVERSAPSSLCPADGSAVRAENLVLHWVPRNRSVVLALSWGKQVRWRQTVQNGASGTLVSENARVVLEILKDKDGGEVEFRVQDENGSEAAATFYVLSREEEAKVESQLAPWQLTIDPLMKALGMAYVFSSQKLYEEAAEQYHLALQQSPQSLTLQEAAREADLRAGRSEPSREAR